MFSHVLQGVMRVSCSSLHPLPLTQGTLEISKVPASLVWWKREFSMLPLHPDYELIPSSVDDDRACSGQPLGWRPRASDCRTPCLCVVCSHFAQWTKAGLVWPVEYQWSNDASLPKLGQERPCSFLLHLSDHFLWGKPAVMPWGHSSILAEKSTSKGTASPPSPQHWLASPMREPREAGPPATVFTSDGCSPSWSPTTPPWRPQARTSQSSCSQTPHPEKPWRMIKDSCC